MPSLVRATAAFGVILVASLLMLGAEARAGDCKLVQQTPGGVTVGKKVDVWAMCTDVDYQTTDFLWKIIPIDRMGNRGPAINLGGGLRTSRLQNVHYDAPGTYEIELSYGPASAPNKWQKAALPMTAAPSPPPLGAPVTPAPPPPQVAFLDQVTFSPASFTLRPGERATVTATRPNIGDPHIQWSIPGVKGTAVDRWTMAFSLRNPGDYTLDVLVTDGSNSVNTRRFALPIKVTAATLDVGLQGHTTLQLNERAPVVVTPRNGVAPYHLNVSVAGGNSGSSNFDRQTTFLVPTKTPGTKAVTVSVSDAQGSSFSRTVNFSVGVAAPAPPPPNGANPFTGSYKATVTGPKPANTNTYWGHVVGYTSDGTMNIALYALQDNFHVTIKGGALSVNSGNGVRAQGAGSIAGNGAIGTTITMNWTLTGSDGKPLPYHWVLTKYDDRDFGGPQSGFAR
jgi:hypothetical protein